MQSDGMHVAVYSLLIMSALNLYEFSRVRRVVKLDLTVSEVKIASC